ncbi:MAG: DUF3137 domain-containing protein [Planctomycetota bacterium]|nr:DUF3137 domain-containing protein [Planctomycetota bacterium]
MGIMRTLFPPKPQGVWRQLSERVGGRFLDGGLWKGDKVEVDFRQWVITLDTYTVSTGQFSSTYTRLRAPYCNAEGFRFKVYRKSVFTGLGKLLGLQDLEIGDPFFDEAFVIQANDAPRVRELLANERVRALIAAQPSILFSVQDDEGWFGRTFPDGVDELYFTTVGVIKDVERLQQLFELFAEVLDELCRMGSAYEDNPGL